MIKEASRATRGTAVWDALLRDGRYALRRLARDWRFTAAGVLILGLGIGATTATFSVVNAVLFRRQPLPNPDRVVDIYQNDREGRPLATSYAAYLDIAEFRDLFAGTMAASIPDSVRYLHDGAVRNGVVVYSTSTYLDVLGLRPSLGRWFEEREQTPGAPPVAVLGRQIWTTVFRADPSIVGRTIRMQGMAVTIVGVGPADHRGPLDIGLVTDFWMPISATRAMHGVAASGGDPTQTDEPVFLVKGRLREGRTVAQAAAAMDVLGRRRAAEHPDTDPGKGISVLPSTDVRIHPQADAPVMAVASLVLVVVGLVLAIACSNLATLLLVRGAARAKEVSVRLAMGATRRQIVRHLLTESVLLSGMGGLAGCLLTWWGSRWLRSVELPISVDMSPDLRVLGFAVAVSVVTGMAFGLAPALKAARVDLLPSLRDEGTPAIDHRRLTLKNALIVFQVALSVLLLGGATVYLQMLAAARAVPVGFAVDGVAMIETDLRYAGHTAVRAMTLSEELRRRIAAVPGVESSALLRGLPMRVNGVPIVVDGAEQLKAEVVAGALDAGPEFFETLRIPLLHGRVFDARDRVDTPPVAVITATMAQQYFGTVNAVGRRFRPKNEPNAWMEVIGVVRDTGTGDFGDDVLDPIPQLFYRSYTQSAGPTTVVARTSLDAATLVAAMQRALRELDVNAPVITAKTMSQDLEDSRAQPKVLATFLGVLGVSGLVLASIGLYAVVAFAVARRSREIGIRMALGARGRQVVWSIARGVAGLIGVGTGVGLMLAVLAMLALRAASAPSTSLGHIVVFRPEIDPVALAAIAGLMALVGVAAAFVPARRAARMDPLAALRRE